MPTIRPAGYRTVVAVAGAALAGIVLTGAAVRLTEAGLGCENWPACTDERFIPEWSFHPWIEFGNRLFTGVVSAAVAAAVLTAHLRQPRRPDLIRWSWGLVAGVGAQIAIGAITVVVDLHPALVGLHYLVSMALLWNAVVLWVRASSGGAATEPVVDSATLNLSRAMVAATAIGLATGTLVTGTGPNSGDARAERLQLDLSAITRIHSVAMWVVLALVLALVVRLQRSPHAGPAARGRILVAALVTQGAVGYLQFATGVPPLLVGVHIAGSVVIWVLVVLLHLGLWARPSLDDAPPDGPVRDSALRLERMGA